VNQSDKYYINEDKRAQAAAQLKGGAKVMAQKIQEEYHQGLESRAQRMRREARERKAHNEKLVKE